MQIGIILVGQAWASVSTLLKPALKLCEKPKVTPEMPIRVQKIALQDVSGAGLGVRAKARVFVVLVAVAYFAADREIPVFPSQRDVLQIIQNLFLAIGISE